MPDNQAAWSWSTVMVNRSSISFPLGFAKDKLWLPFKKYPADGKQEYKQASPRACIAFCFGGSHSSGYPMEVAREERSLNYEELEARDSAGNKGQWGFRLGGTLLRSYDIDALFLDISSQVCERSWWILYTLSWLLSDKQEERDGHFYGKDIRDLHSNKRHWIDSFF